MKYSHWKIKRTIAVAFICLLMLSSPAQGQMGPLTWHVSEHVVGGTGFGDTWANANPSLTDALSTAQPGDTILVGQGVYHPAPDQSFTIDFGLNQLKLIGGYAGWLPTGVLAPDPDQRDVQANRSILSGDILDNDSIFTAGPDNWHDESRDDNVDIVVMVQNVTRGGLGTRLDGFFIEGAAGGSPISGELSVLGGGIYIDDSAMDIVNCTFRYNATGILPGAQYQFGLTSDGGGATVRGGQKVGNEVQYTRFINCTFHDNIAARGGALAVVDGSLIPTQVKVVNSLFYNNQALVISTLVLQAPDGSGGAIIVVGEEPSDSDSMIEITKLYRRE